MAKLLKRLLRSEDGSISVFEGLMLAFFFVAVIVAVRFLAYSAPKPPAAPIKLEQEWPELPPREPLGPFHPLKK